ncbi:DUF4136 domain-containing protein [Rhodoferax sp.]|uniref:DUF4136 domain-containing protein n=1 Tax=Rhodoferax sp. TaxID=50421 RepID=UPI00374C9235
MLLWRTLVLAAVVLLSGCANLWRVQSEVHSFTSGATVVTPATFRFERLPSQQADAANQAQLEAIALPALARAGLVLDANSTRYSLQITAQALEAVLWDELYGYNGPWIGGGPFGPRWPYQPRLMREPPRLYQRQIGLALRELATGQVVYESHASYDSRWPIDNKFMPILFDAALQGFPNPPQGGRTVTIDIPH